MGRKYSRSSFNWTLILTIGLWWDCNSGTLILAVGLWWNGITHLGFGETVTHGWSLSLLKHSRLGFGGTEILTIELNWDYCIRFWALVGLKYSQLEFYGAVILAVWHM